MFLLLFDRFLFFTYRRSFFLGNEEINIKIRIRKKVKSIQGKKVVFYILNKENKGIRPDKTYIRK